MGRAAFAAPDHQVLAEVGDGLQVARGQTAGPVSISQIAEGEGLSPQYTAKLMRQLRMGELVTSVRGAEGGYRLARPAGEISVWSALQVLGGEFFPDGFSFTTTLTFISLANGYTVQFLPIEYHERVGRSKIRPVSDTLGFLQLILRCGFYFAPLRFFLPVMLALIVATTASVAWDVAVERNLTDKTVILALSALNTSLLALLADMIDRRSGR